MPAPDESAPVARLDALDAIRGVAILLVVGVHAQGYAQPMDATTATIMALIVNQICVPVFFLVDGWIEGHRTLKGRTGPYGEAVRSSARRLLLPWLLFTVAYGVARYLFERLGVLDSQIVYSASALEVLIAAWGSVYTPQLYFLVSLFLIRLLNPLHQSLVRRFGFVPLALLALAAALIYRWTSPVTVALLDIEGGQEPLLHAFYNYQFYLAGLALRHWPPSWSARRCATVLLIAYLGLCAAYLTLDLSGYGYYLKYPYLIGAFLFAMTGALNWAPLLALGRDTMPIYLLHVPIVMKLAAILCAAVPVPALLSVLLVWSVTLALTLALIRLIRLLPYHGILFGEPIR
ncbi:MAG: acyltransferase [Pseudomonadota bacterium]